MYLLYDDYKKFDKHFDIPNYKGRTIFPNITMQQPTKSSICVRLTPKCRDSVELVTKNASSPKEIRLINRNSNDFVLYEFDEIYAKQTTNQLLYQSLIFTPGVSSINDLESGLFCFLGSQGVGKTYTVTGQLTNLWQNCGLLGYLMQDLFSPTTITPSKLSSFPSTSVQLRFLQVMGENVENIGFQTVYGESTNQRELGNRIDYKIDIKSMAHFENCIHKIYQRKKPHMHLVIELTLKNEPLIYTTKKTTLTFIEVSSACFDEGNAHYQKIKSEVEALITIFQNIQRIKHLQHLFQSSKLTKLLKNNFFDAKKISLVGILDNSFKGNSITLKWLKMSLQFKQDKTIIQSMKEDIKKQEEYLKSLMQKHKKAMTLLSKCIGTELSFLQKQKNFVTSKRTDFGFGNSFNKRCQKINLANNKKQQNEEEIDKLNKEIATIEEELDFMECEHKDAMKKVQEERNEILSVKNKLMLKMEEMTQQLLGKNLLNTSGSGNSLFWRPSLDFENVAVGQDKKTDKQFDNSTVNKKEHTSCNTFFKNSTNKISPNPPKSNITIPPSITKIQRKRLHQDQNHENFLIQIKRQQCLIKHETKRQIYELFKLISVQQQQLENVLKEHPEKLSTGLMNKIKGRQCQGLDIVLEQAIDVYLKEGKEFELEKYQEFTQNQKIFTNIARDLRSKQKKSQKNILNA